MFIISAASKVVAMVGYILGFCPSALTIYSPGNIVCTRYKCRVQNIRYKDDQM